MEPWGRGLSLAERTVWDIYREQDRWGRLEVEGVGRGWLWVGGVGEGFEPSGGEDGSM